MDPEGPEVVVQAQRTVLGIEEQVEMNLEQVVLAPEEEPAGLEWSEVTLLREVEPEVEVLEEVAQIAWGLMKERGAEAGAIPETSGDSEVTLGAEVGAGLEVHLDTQMISGAEAQAGAGVEVKATEEKELMESKGEIHMNGFTF